MKILGTLLGLFTLLSVHTQSPATVKWYTFDEAVALAKTTPKPMMIDLYTDWCGWCKVMDSKTFSHPVIAAILNTQFYPVKFDAEQKAPVTFKEREYKFMPSGMRGYHELAAALTSGQLSYPTLVFLDEQQNMIQPLAGYQTPENLEPVIVFFGSGAYKTTPWEQFSQQFKSKLNG